MTTPPETPTDNTPVLTALIRELRTLGEREAAAAPPKPKAMSCDHLDCDEDPAVAFLDGEGKFCAYHGLLNLLIPAGALVVQQVLQEAHPLWQVNVIAAHTDPGPQGPADARADRIAGMKAGGIPAEALDAELNEPEQDWVFTFGSGHELNGGSLGNRFVRIRGTKLSARSKMIGYFGVRWSHQYPSEEQAGVQRFGLTELSLPPSPWPQEPTDG